MSLIREMRLKSDIYKFLVDKEELTKKLNEYFTSVAISSVNKVELHEFLEEHKLLDLL